jgi:hypothetical protein
VTTDLLHPSPEPRRLIARAVPIAPIPSALPEYLERIERWERTSVARRIAEFVDSGELPAVDPSDGYHFVYGYSKIESAIDYVRREMYKQRLVRPIVWHSKAPLIRWWKEALAEWKPVAFFAGQKAQKFRSHMMRWNSSPHVRMAVAHYNLLTSINVFECRFTRTFEIVFFDFPFNARMVKQAVDLTLRDTSFGRVYVDFLCVRDTLDHRASEVMVRELMDLYRQPA